MSPLEAGDTDMLNDECPSGRFDPVVVRALRWSATPPSFTSSSQAIDRLARLEQAQYGPMSMNGTGSVRDERDEQLARAGYLLVVGTDRFVRAVAGFVWRIARFLLKQGMTRRQIGAQPSGGGRKTQAAARIINAPSAVFAPSVEIEADAE
jgi:hypothetical protein